MIKVSAIPDFALNGKAEWLIAQVVRLAFFCIMYQGLQRSGLFFQAITDETRAEERSFQHG
jgi:hypothetical protein